MAENNMDVLTVNRTYKSRIFAMLFSDRNELLKLYNAINGTSYDDPDLLQINNWRMQCICPCRMMFLLLLSWD